MPWLIRQLAGRGGSFVNVRLNLGMPLSAQAPLIGTGNLRGT